MTTTLQPVQALVPGANLEAYVQTVNSLPLLTVEQERELAGRRGALPRARRRKGGVG